MDTPSFRTTRRDSVTPSALHQTNGRPPLWKAFRTSQAASLSPLTAVARSRPHRVRLACASFVALLGPCTAYGGDAARALDYRVGKFFGGVNAHVVARTSTDELGIVERSAAVAGRSEKFAVMVEVRRETVGLKEAHSLIDPNSPAMRAQYEAAKERMSSVDVGGIKYRLYGLRGVGAKYSVSQHEWYEANVRRSSLTGKPRFSVQYRQQF